MTYNEIIREMYPSVVTIHSKVNEHSSTKAFDQAHNAVTIDLAAVEIAWADGASARAAAQVQANRRAAYQAEADHLHFEEARGEVSDGTWAAKVAEIKARFPKD